MMGFKDSKDFYFVCTKATTKTVYLLQLCKSIVYCFYSQSATFSIQTNSYMISPLFVQLLTPINICILFFPIQFICGTLFLVLQYILTPQCLNTTYKCIVFNTVDVCQHQLYAISCIQKKRPRTVRIIMYLMYSLLTFMNPQRFKDSLRSS